MSSAVATDVRLKAQTAEVVAQTASTLPGMDGVGPVVALHAIAPTRVRMPGSRGRACYERTIARAGPPSPRPGP